MRFTAVSNILTGNLRPDAQIRYWVWCPRVDYTACLQYITNAKTLSILPYNMFTVYKTGMIKVGNAGLGHINSGDDSNIPSVNQFPQMCIELWLFLILEL